MNTTPHDASPFRMLSHEAHSSSLRLVRAPRAARLLARMVAVTVLLTAAAMVFVPWQQTATGSGRVVAFAPTDRQQNIEAPMEGRLTQWHVQEGSRVRRGDPLAEITDNDPLLLQRLGEERDAVRARVEAGRARVASIESRIEQLGGSRESARSAAGARARMAADRVRAARQSLAASEASELTTERNAERQRALQGQGLASTRALELAELDLIRAQTETDRARATLNASVSEESALQSDRLRIGTDASAGIDDARAAQAAGMSEVASATAELSRIE
ncbi:MAG: biotin/lipoyl-binding protein, partial [Deltaproteobacteria bacterium]